MTTVLAVGAVVLIILAVFIGMSMDTEGQQAAARQIARERRSYHEERRRLQGERWRLQKERQQLHEDLASCRKASSDLTLCENCPFRTLLN